MPPTARPRLRGTRLRRRPGAAGHFPLRRHGRGHVRPAAGRGAAGPGCGGAHGRARGETVSYGATWTAARPTTVATLGVGYADGLPRATERAGRSAAPVVELRGRTVPVIGRVTMDMCMVAVEDGEVAVGDVATRLRRRRLARPAGAGRRHDLLRAADRARYPALPRLYRMTPPRGDHRARRARHRAGARHRRLRRRRQQHAGQRGAPGRRPLAAPARGPRAGPLRARSPACRAVASPSAAHGSCEPASAGKDSTTGHWEICGLVAGARLSHLSRTASPRR